MPGTGQDGRAPPRTHHPVFSTSLVSQAFCTVSHAAGKLLNDQGWQRAEGRVRTLLLSIVYPVPSTRVAVDVRGFAYRVCFPRPLFIPPPLMRAHRVVVKPSPQGPRKASSAGALSLRALLS